MLGLATATAAVGQQANATNESWNESVALSLLHDEREAVLE